MTSRTRSTNSVAFSSVWILMNLKNLLLNKVEQINWLYFYRSVLQFIYFDKLKEFIEIKIYLRTELWQRLRRWGLRWNLDQLTLKVNGSLPLIRDTKIKQRHEIEIAHERHSSIHFRDTITTSLKFKFEIHYSLSLSDIMTTNLKVQVQNSLFISFE